MVEADQVLGPDRVRPGDVAIAMAASGLHSNGYSLARHVLLSHAGWELDREVPEFGRSLGEELLEPTRIYTKDCLALARNEAIDVKAFSHITGGGLAANIARVLPVGLHLDVGRDSWTPPPVFTVVGAVGSVETAELERTFNMGIGMLAIVDPASVEATTSVLAQRGITNWICGEVREATAADESDSPAKGGSGG